MSGLAPEAETWVACLTPPGTAAIATLGLHGPNAWTVVRRLFHPVSKSGQPLPEQPETGRVWVGRFGAELAEEVVLLVKHAGPVPSLELHCHGGREVLRLLLETMQARGIRSGSWQDFERLTSGDPQRAAAAVALAQAPTTRTAVILLDQYHGAFARSVKQVVAALDRNDLAEASRLLSALLRYAEVGRHLTDGWRVVIAGAPNVGKSSLVNALAGFQRSVVSAVPGTTRDVVTTRIAVEGWPIELVDTAGLRAEAKGLEAQGMHRARTAAATADLCLWLLDVTTEPVRPVAEALPAEKVRVLVNKIDLPATWDPDQEPEAVRVSARTGAGLPELCQAMARWLVPAAPAPGAAVPFTSALGDRIEEAWQHCAAGRIAEARTLLAACGLA